MTVSATQVITAMHSFMQKENLKKMVIKFTPLLESPYRITLVVPVIKILSPVFIWHPNKFNYIPRYYDPEKEAREQRRAELRGERAEDADREYQPGQYIRTQREARDARRSNEEERGRIRVLKMAAGAVLVLLFIYLLYPKLADVFLRARTAPATETQQVGEEEFNPYAPIRVVPNDYEE